MKKVRWGLLSTANINRALIPAIRKSSRSDLVGVASRTQDSARDYARKWKIPFYFGSYQEMLKSGEIDAVYIGLPNHLHAEWSVKALNAGVAVLCEKPFAISLAQVEAMIKASRENNLPLAEAFMYRHHPQTKLVGQWVRDGNLGRITVIKGAFEYVLPTRQRQPDNLNVRLVPEYGGGCLWDVGVYPLSYGQYLMGRAPDWVVGSQHLGETGVDEVFTAQLSYGSEGDQPVIGQFTGSFSTPFQTFMEITGTEGRLYLTRPFASLERGAQVLFTDIHGKTKKLPVPKKSLYLGEVEDLEAALLDGKPTLVSLEESRDHILTALALYQSAKTGKTVSLEEYQAGK
jgi:xylose dehydrogenase (NAD/NADP)